MSKTYFFYLLAKNKVTLVFFYLVHLCLSLSPLASLRENRVFSISMATNFCLISAFILAIILPMLLFKFVHRKTSSDCYFCLPIKREKQFITIVIFSWLSIYLFYALNFSFILLLSNTSFSLLNLFILYFLTFLFILALVIFTSATYLIANNLFDGVIICCAYFVAPFLISLIIIQFFISFVVGVNGFNYALDFAKNTTIFGAIFNFIVRTDMLFTSIRVQYILLRICLLVFWCSVFI